MSWAMVITGGVLMLTPMYLNPTMGINGMTLLGIIIAVAGVSKAVTEGKQNV